MSISYDDNHNNVFVVFLSAWEASNNVLVLSLFLFWYYHLLKTVMHYGTQITWIPCSARVTNKPTFTGQLLNFSFHHPYTVKKGIVYCLQHRAKTNSRDADAYQKETISLRHNYPERITSDPRNLDRMIENNTQKVTTACLPYVKGLAERIQKICSPFDIRAVFTSGSTLRRYLFRVKPPTEFNLIKNCVYSIPCSCGKIYKGETGRPLKVRLEEHWKAVVRGEIEKSDMANHIWKEKGNHHPLWGKVEMIDWAEHWRIRRLKESAHMLGFNDLLSRPSIQLNTIWEPIIKKARWKNNLNMSIGN